MSWILLSLLLARRLTLKYLGRHLGSAEVNQRAISDPTRISKSGDLRLRTRVVMPRSLPLDTVSAVDVGDFVFLYRCCRCRQKVSYSFYQSLLYYLLLSLNMSERLPHDLNCLTISELQKHAAVMMDKQTRDYYNEVG